MPWTTFDQFRRQYQADERMQVLLFVPESADLKSIARVLASPEGGQALRSLISTGDVVVYQKPQMPPVEDERRVLAIDSHPACLLQPLPALNLVH